MFTKRIIPCLDVNNGRVVKGVNFCSSFADAEVFAAEIAKAYVVMRREQMNWYFWILQHPANRETPS